MGEFLAPQSRKFSRDKFIAGAAAAAIPLLVGGRPVEGQRATSPDVAHDANPIIILPSDITTDKDPNQKTKDNENFQTAEFTSLHFPYKIKNWPTDWIYEPGLAYNKEIDMFFGKFFRGTQTKAWAFATPLEEDQTSEKLMNTIQQALQHEQDKQGKAQDLPLPASNYVGTIDGRLEKIAGYDGWSITAPMLGYGSDSSSEYFQANMGFVKAKVAYQFNLETSSDSLTIHYEYDKKFVDAMNSLEILK
jgi:hypothetical protein